MRSISVCNGILFSNPPSLTDNIVIQHTTYNIQQIPTNASIFAHPIQKAVFIPLCWIRRGRWTAEGMIIGFVKIVGKVIHPFKQRKGCF